MQVVRPRMVVRLASEEHVLTLAHAGVPIVDGPPARSGLCPIEPAPAGDGSDRSTERTVLRQCPSFELEVFGS
jgi:hypothetical protein